ncbi:MAG TPA: PAS domain-containing protein, partial [Cytophagaceae bacterium]
MDFISCRNLLIYLNPVLQKKILSTFHFALNLSGYLFMGPSENNGDLKSSLEEISKKWKIYKNIQAPRWRGWDSIGGNGLAIKTPEERIKRPPIGSYINLSDALNDALYEDQEYAGIFVDENLELMHAEGNFKDFIQFTDKKLNLNFLKILPLDLSTALSKPLRTVIKTKEKLVIKGIKVRQDNKIRNINAVIKPYLKEYKSQKFILILLRESIAIELPVTPTHEIALDPSDYGSQWLSDLQQELKDTKENLQSAIEELETSNEELQSANEEMLSANEELQSTNEELQSLNEELHTINSEYQLKIKELIELNDDMNNYFRSSDVSQIFLDKNLHIRKYTPSATKHINLIESDIGRSITHISNNLKFENLIGEIKQVIAKSYTVDREIQLFDGRWYQMKILPYVRQDRRTDGAIVTFFEITHLKNLNNIVSGVLNSSLSGIIAFKSIRDGANNNYKIKDFEIITLNDASQKILGMSHSELIEKSLLQVMPEHKSNGLFDKYVHVVETGDPIHFVHMYEQEGMEKYLEIVAVKMEDGFTATFIDITEKKNAENKLRITNEELKKAQETLKRMNYDLEKRVLERTRELSLREELFRLVSLATNDAIWDWDLAGNKVKWNEAFYELFDYKAEQIEEGIESKYNRIHPDDKDKIITKINDFFQSGERLWSAEYRFQCANGNYAFIRDRGYLLRDENNTPYRMLGSIIDLSNLKKTQDELNKSNE